MDELEQLNRPLDVRERPSPQLQVEFGILACGNPLTLHASLDPAYLGNLLVSDRAAEDERVGKLHEPLAQLAVAGDRTRSKQCLSLPGLGPSLEVQREAVEVTESRP